MPPYINVLIDINYKAWGEYKMNKDRKLASVQVVKSVNPIKGADFIESIGILGWECVASKGDFKVGDKCVYFEIDSFLPIRPEYEILRANSYKNNEFMGEGFRIKTQKFRGKLSQGYIVSMGILPSGEYNIGDDVSELLGVKQWEREEVKGSDGTIIADLPAFLKSTHEYRIQSFPDILEEFKGKPYYITNKVDGQSTTVFKHMGIVGVCNHDVQLSMEDYKYIEEIQAAIKSIENIDNIAIQGEMAGPGILGNKPGFAKKKFQAFNIMDTLTRQFYDYRDFIEFCREHFIETVELEEIGESFNYTLEELLDKADGAYTETGKRREGIVIRPQTENTSEVLSDRLSFKVINNKYLLKNNE